MENRCAGANKREVALNQVYLCSNRPLSPKCCEKVLNGLSSVYYTTHTIPFHPHHVPFCMFYTHLSLSTPHHPLICSS
ncbi:hypothetical protein Y032_0030g2140 [Ancylostoma ceylanicum]|uniref:Uncharacterized protein n=1 Tax=Ancylostoma ceylanicum TaxID=53326 RepID=A0A016US03_9BILA|nr:hypothetical protein Y032_0030g2140 [Ancylostoma ceylanicum]